MVALLSPWQDAAYHESLRADREKAAAEAEARAAAQAAAQLQAQLDAKAAGLPAEPAADEAGAVNLLVRLPGGGRLSRRFRQSDLLQARGCQGAGNVAPGGIRHSLPPAATCVLAVDLS